MLIVRCECEYLCLSDTIIKNLLTYLLTYSFKDTERAICIESTPQNTVIAVANILLFCKKGNLSFNNCSWQTATLQHSMQNPTILLPQFHKTRSI